MIFITGDTHRNFSRIVEFCRQHETTKEDIMVILGDAGINYCGDINDIYLKQYLSKLPITLFCIHGNHEMRPWHVKDMISGKFHGGIVLYEKAFPNIVYAVDGEVYDLNNKSCLVCGGAYSVDKYFRLATGRKWFSDEQPDAEIKARVTAKCEELKQVDCVLTHTCPAKYTPIEMFLPDIDQSNVDRTTEEFLDLVEESVDYRRWYCGHWHTDKIDGKMHFMFNDIFEFGA